MSVTGFVVAVLAAYLGGAIEGLEGALFGALLGYPLGAVIDLTRRVKRLEKALETQPDRAASPAPEPEQMSPPVPSSPAPATVTPAEPTAEPPVEPAVPPPPPAATIPPLASEFPSFNAPLDPMIARVKAFFTDGNIMVKVGLLVLFIGIGFLLKLAAERHTFPVELRVAGVGAGGLVLLVLGWRLRDRRRVYGLSLQRGGVGIMYLTVFAAARLYGSV